MQRTTGDIPNNAHQQTSIPLLRRPRAPKPIKVEPEKSKKVSPLKNDDFCDVERAMDTSDISYLEFEETDDKSNFIIHSLYPRGPAFFPPGHTRHSHDTAGGRLAEPLAIIEEDPDMHNLHAWMPPRPVIRTSQSAMMISRQNYKKLTGWFATHVPTQANLNMVNFHLKAGTPPTRKPAQQAIIEFRALLDEVLCTGSAISMETNGEEELNRWPTPTPDDILFRSTTSKFFCGQGRCDSPFDASRQPLIDPSEVAVIESMVGGGTHLTFKAHFISQLPDLCPLSHTLTHLNLSFNNFTVFPTEVLQLEELLCLRMRNNPLKEIPQGIQSLSKLKVLCVSFSLLSDLPPGLFELVSLVDLDLSYNALHCLSRDIAKLVSLRKLNVEGNQLSGLPYPAAHSLPLTQLLIGDNLTHPLLWRENTRNQPQALLDLCCIAMETQKLHPELLPNTATECISRRKNGVCDLCGGVVYGAGLRVIRSINHTHFRVKNLPFIFIVCSPVCRREAQHRENFDLCNTSSDQQNLMTKNLIIHNNSDSNNYSSND